MAYVTEKIVTPGTTIGIFQLARKQPRQAAFTALGRGFEFVATPEPGGVGWEFEPGREYTTHIERYLRNISNEPQRIRVMVMTNH